MTAALTISCVLYKTEPSEVARLISQVAAIPLPTHLYLVDNSPEPIAIGGVDGSRVTIIRPGRNIGYGRANNLAIHAAAGQAKYHLVLNSDLLFEGTDVARLTAFMDARPSAVLVAPRVCYPDGRIQPLCRLLPTPLDMLARRAFTSTAWSRRRVRRYGFEDWGYDRVASFPSLSGCFMLMRADALAAVGGFDERYFLYAEDMDLSRRLHSIGETLFVPFVTIVHDYRSRSGRNLTLLRHLTINVARYFNKWGWIADRNRDAINARCLEQFAGLSERAAE